VVIDNAATHEQARSLLPTEPSGAAIVTSRHTLGMLGARLVDLDILTPKNAADMLDSVLRIARPDDRRVTDHPAVSARIAELCKGLPLAMRIIAALLGENPRRPLAEMAADLDDERTRLDELSYDDTAVRAAFDLPYRRLDQDHARLFRLLTINPGPDISTQATVALADIDERAARRELETLARAHLIEPGTSYGRWRMHDLLRLYARQLLDAHAADDGREQAGDRLLHYYLDMARAADKHVQARPGTEIPGVLNRGDALVWLAAERLNLIAEIAMADNTGENRIAAQLSTFLAHYTEWRRCVNEQLAARRVSLHAVERLAERGYRARARMNGSAAPFELMNP